MSAPVESDGLPSHLTVSVIRATGLRAKTHHGGTNPYVTLQLGQKTISTPVLHDTLLPRWNTTITFPLPTPQDSSTAALTLTIMHRRSLLALPDKFLGTAHFNLDSILKPECNGKKGWFVLHSEPRKKAKKRGHVEVSFQLSGEPGNLHSHSQAHSQPSSICASSHISGESDRLRLESSVLPVQRHRKPIQPSCAEDSGLDSGPPSVLAGPPEPAASPDCISISTDYNGSRPVSSESPRDTGDVGDQESGECLLGPGHSSSNGAAREKSTGQSIGTQTSRCFQTFPFQHFQGRAVSFRSKLKHLNYNWDTRGESSERKPLRIPVSSTMFGCHSSTQSPPYERLPKTVTFKRRPGFFARLCFCFGDE